MADLYLVPARDAAGAPKRVPDPITGAPLPAEGAFKPAMQYWLRRVAQGDVTRADPPSAQTPPFQPPTAGNDIAAASAGNDVNRPATNTIVPPPISDAEANPPPAAEPPARKPRGRA